MRSLFWVPSPTQPPRTKCSRSSICSSLVFSHWYLYYWRSKILAIIMLPTQVPFPVPAPHLSTFRLPDSRRFVGSSDAAWQQKRRLRVKCGFADCTTGKNRVRIRVVVSQWSLYCTTICGEYIFIISLFRRAMISSQQMLNCRAHAMITFRIMVTECEINGSKNSGLEQNVLYCTHRLQHSTYDIVNNTMPIKMFFYSEYWDEQRQLVGLMRKCVFFYRR